MLRKRSRPRIGPLASCVLRKRSQPTGTARVPGRTNRLLVVERGGSLMQGLVALRWDGCCEASNRTRTTSCDRAYVLAA